MTVRPPAWVPISTTITHHSSHQETADKAKAVGVDLHPLLHCGIETMGRNERATFVVTADGMGNDAENKEEDTGTATELSTQRRFEYDISLDHWTEEIDLSERQDNSLVKRVIMDGDAVTRPVDIGAVTVRFVYHLDSPAKKSTGFEFEAGCGAEYFLDFVSPLVD